MNYQFNPYETKDASVIEHDLVLSSLKLILSKPEGKVFIKYLMKHFGVGEYPQAGLDERMLLEYVGFLRAGESIFSLCAQAEPTTAGLILAEIQKEKYNV